MTGSDLERLLADDAWLRRLARRLAGDAATADDLVQETWLAALAAPPAGSGGDRRPWLAGALRNRWRMLVRGDARRAARERDAAPRENGAPADEVAQELVLRRGVVDALLALDEPDRGVVFRRFFKDASLTAIAAADGVAVSTVHARLERGLARMRARLDALHAGRGGRAAWSLGLLRIAELAPAGPGIGVNSGPGGPSAGAAQTTWFGGAIVMTAMAKAAAVLLVAAAAVTMGLWWQGRGEPGPPEVAAARSAAAPDAPDRALAGPALEIAGRADPMAEVAASGERRAAPSRAPEPTTSAAAPARIHHHGRLADLSGAPLAGVTVRLLASPRPIPGHGQGHGHGIQDPPAPAGAIGAPPPPVPTVPVKKTAEETGPPAPGSGIGADAELGVAVTDGEGGFAIELPAGVPERAAVPGMPDLTMPRGYELEDPRLRLAFATVDLDGMPLLFAAPRATFAGVVLDPGGAPAPDTEVELIVADTLLSSLGIPFAIDLALPAWSTRTDHAGRFRFADAFGGAHASLRVTRGLYVGGPHALPVHDDLDIVLRLRARDDVLAVRGVVLDAAGRPVPGAVVALGGETEEADVQGRFELAWDPEHERKRAAALRPGFQPRPMPQSHVAAFAPELGFARVELTHELIRDPVVLRLGGAPLAIDGRVVDGAGDPLARAQVWMTDPTHFGTRREISGAAFRLLQPVSLEELWSGRRGAVTGADGRFRLEGLLARDYALQAFDPRTSSFGPGWAVAAGATGVELRLPVEPSARRVAGRLVSLGGKPLGGVEVRPLRRLEAAQLEGPPEQTDRGVSTDAKGRFAFPELAVEGTDLVVFGGPALRYQVEHFPLAGFPDLAEIEIVLPLSCDLQIVLLTPSSATAARVLDAAGDALEILEHHGNFTTVHAVADLRGGRSSVLAVSELARELVLLSGGEEVVRLPLRLDPDRRTVVEY